MIIQNYSSGLNKYIIYETMTPPNMELTMTRRQNRTVSWFLNRLENSLE